MTSVLRKDPFTCTEFVFCTRLADLMKLLYWDGTGLVMDYAEWSGERPSHYCEPVQFVVMKLP